MKLNLIKDKMQLPSKKTKYLSVFISLIFILTLGLSAYLTSFLRGKINDKLFTISQSLAFGNHPSLVILFTLAIGLLMYLIYLRGPHNNLFILRLGLLVVIYSLLITILWITTYYSKLDHYSIAGVIFLLLTIYICLTSYTLYNHKMNMALRLFLIGLPVLIMLVNGGLIVGNVPNIKNDYPQIFPSFENSAMLAFILSILALGFI